MTSHVPGIVLRENVVIGEEVVPSRADAHRLRRVLRLRPGAMVRGLTPDGAAVFLRVDQRPGGELRLVVVGHEESSAASLGGLTVAVALIKRMAHLDFVIEKGTEVGVTAWWAVATALCADAGLQRSYQHRLERWRRIAEAASIQCGRPTVPDVRGVMQWPELLQSAPSFRRRFVAAPDAEVRLRGIVSDPDASILFLVGPEGGWCAAERHSFEELCFTPVSLGPSVLRSETAALVGSVLLMSGRE